MSEPFKYTIEHLRPTQAVVGMRVIEAKTYDYLRLSPDEFKKFLKQNLVPVVSAPDGNFYMIDHHHEAIAASKMGSDHVFCALKQDYSKLKDMPTFWTKMEEKKWVYLADKNGVEITVKNLPKDLMGMADDPYRSLSWFARQQGAYQKTDVPFVEFYWGALLRKHIKLQHVQNDFSKAIADAVVLCQSPDAKHLPGFNG